MGSSKLTIKNYRCFEDSSPLFVRFGAGGFKAFIGTNNSGKSTILKFFYEFRQLFNFLVDSSRFLQWITQRALPFSFDAQGIEDHVELFSDFNDRDLIIEWELEKTNPQLSEIIKVIITIKRDNPKQYTIKYKCTGGEIQGVGGNRGGWNFDVQINQQHFPIEAKEFLSIFDAIGNAMYIGPFRNAISEAHASYYDISIGSAFISTWHQWKTGGNRIHNQIAQTITDDIASIFGFRRLELNMAPNSIANLQVIADGKPYRLRELGSGIAQFFVVFASVAMKKPKMLLIDEPELNLHPSLQITFLTSLAAYAQDYVFFCTHSIGLARSTAEEIFTCQRKDNKTVIRPYEAIQNPIEFLGEMSFSTFKDLGGEGILLVEGVTEIKTIQQILRKFGKDKNFILLSLSGSEFIEKERNQELEEITRLSTKVIVLIDSERSVKDASLENKRQAFVDSCEKLKFKVHVMNLRAIENYFTQSAIDEALGRGKAALGSYDSLQGHQYGWSKNNNWKIAKAMTREDWMENDIGLFLSQL